MHRVKVGTRADLPAGGWQRNERRQQRRLFACIALSAAVGVGIWVVLYAQHSSSHAESAPTEAPLITSSTVAPTLPQHTPAPIVVANVPPQHGVVDGTPRPRIPTASEDNKGRKRHPGRHRRHDGRNSDAEEEDLDAEGQRRRDGDEHSPHRPQLHSKLHIPDAVRQKHDEAVRRDLSRDRGGDDEEDDDKAQHRREEKSDRDVHHSSSGGKKGAHEVDAERHERKQRRDQEAKRKGKAGGRVLYPDTDSDPDDLSSTARIRDVVEMNTALLKQMQADGVQQTNFGLFAGSRDGLRIGDIPLSGHDIAKETYTAKDAKNLDFSVSNDVQLFVIWNGAMGEAQKILSDMRRQFIVLAVSYFDWPAFHLKPQSNASKAFENNLWRIYSGKGGWVRKGMPLKVKQCGLGPFIAAVVLDPTARYEAEKTAHGIDTVNHNMNAAKKRYREWAGGGFKVHGTFSGVEAAHDIPFFFHRDTADFLRMYRESHGTANRGQVGRFLAWAEQQPDGLDGLRRPRRHQRHDENETQSPLQGSDSIDAWVEAIKVRDEDAVQIVGERSEEDDARKSPRGRRHRHGHGGDDFSEAALVYKWDTMPRATDAPVALPVGGPAAAEAMRHEAEAERYVVVPYRTTYESLGMYGWRNCRQLLLAIRTFKLTMWTHKHQVSDEATELDTTFAACPTWPAEIDVHVTGQQLWAVVAALGGERPIGGSTTNPVADPPATFEVLIAGTPYKFHYHLSKRNGH